NVLAIRHVTAPVLTLVFAERWSWVVMLGAYVVVSWLPSIWARNMRSRAVAYLALASYALVTAVVFVPLLAVLARATDETRLAHDGDIVALPTFAALVMSIALAKQRFSFVRSALVITAVAG